MKGEFVIETLTQVAFQAADGLIGPHAVVPWWGVVAWLLVMVGGVIGGALRGSAEN